MCNNIVFLLPQFSPRNSLLGTSKNCCHTPSMHQLVCCQRSCNSRLLLASVSLLSTAGIPCLRPAFTSLLPIAGITFCCMVEPRVTPEYVLTKSLRILSQHLIVVKLPLVSISSAVWKFVSQKFDLL